MSIDAVKICKQVLQANMEETEILVGIAFPGQHRILDQLNLLDDYLLTIQDKHNTKNENGLDDDTQSLISSAPSMSDSITNSSSNNMNQNNDLPTGWRVVHDKRTNRKFYMNRYVILLSVPLLL